jgi:Tol biopolymer transport system component
MGSMLLLVRAIVPALLLAVGLVPAATSATGSWILFEERGALFLVDPATGERGDVGVAGVTYDWSPDGERIAFAGDADRGGPEPRRLWVMNADGSGRRPLGPTVPNVTLLEWSPDGSMLAFTQWRSPTSSRLYIVRADGAGLRRLVSGPFATHPKWSPDGKRLLYLNGRTRRGLYVAAVRTRSVKRLVDSVHYYSAPGWSPDGSMISYVKQRRLFVARANGTRSRRLSNLVVWGAPAWSPDGTRIAFESRRGPGSRADIWSIAPGGTGLRRLTHAGEAWAEDDFPEWSPDGTKIAFITDRDSPPNGFREDIYVMNADGSCETLLVGGGPQFLGPPRWRPRWSSGPPLRCTGPKS